MDNHPSTQKNGKALAALILGLAGFFLPLIGFIPAILAIVFGAQGLKQAKETGVGSGLALAGLILGIVGVVFPLLFVGFLALAMFGTLDGALDPVNSFSDRCTFGQEATCEEYAYSNGELRMEVTSNFNDAITISAVEHVGEGNSYTDCGMALPLTVERGDSFTVTCDVGPKTGYEAYSIRLRYNEGRAVDALYATYLYGSVGVN